MRKYSLRKVSVIVAGCVGLVLLCFVGYTKARESNKVVDGRLVSANTKFGFKLFAEIVKQDAGKNIFISPSSVAFALAMTYNGAGGETQRAMARTLELQGINLEEVNRANAALKITLENLDPKVQLVIANSLWAGKGIIFKPEFMKRNKNFYEAEVENLDFNDPSASSIINAWVSRKTNKKIEKIVDDPIDPLTVLFLINAIYFKGNWTVEFDKIKTKEGIFTLLDGTKKKHPMMSQSGDYRYFRGQNFQAVSLPYGDGRMSMYIFLPDKNSSLKEFYQSLNVGNWERWMLRFREMQGDIVLPRFKLKYEANLNDTLKVLGMEVAFDDKRANFGNMCPISVNANVFIKKVKHKTFVEVNEEGTEAAAVTSVEMVLTGIRKRFRMVVDRPFFCAIRDDKTGTVLFMGSIVEPK